LCWASLLLFSFPAPPLLISFSCWRALLLSVLLPSLLMASILPQALLLAADSLLLAWALLLLFPCLLLFLLLLLSCSLLHPDPNIFSFRILHEKLNDFFLATYAFRSKVLILVIVKKIRDQGSG
jgi:hypothetical protein